MMHTSFWCAPPFISFQDESDNAPRFTLSELREVLQEKNLLKGKVMELEEELEQLRPSRRRESVTSDSSRDFDRSRFFLINRTVCRFAYQI